MRAVWCEFHHSFPYACGRYIVTRKRVPFPFTDLILSNRRVVARTILRRALPLAKSKHLAAIKLHGSPAHSGTGARDWPLIGTTPRGAVPLARWCRRAKG